MRDGSRTRSGHDKEADIVVPVADWIVAVHVESALVVVGIEVEVAQLLAKCGICHLYHCPQNTLGTEFYLGPESPPVDSTEFLFEKAC